MKEFNADQNEVGEEMTAQDLLFGEAAPLSFTHDDIKRLMRFKSALLEISELSLFGDSTKYTPASWRNHANKKAAYKYCMRRIDSMLRHAKKAKKDIFKRDSESGARHLIATAWNGLTIATLIDMYQLGDQLNE